MCTKINVENLETVHHEMGHIEYFMQYRPLPEVYHRGANSAFHEAVGDTIALSVMTPNHLQKLGLINTQQQQPGIIFRSVYIFIIFENERECIPNTMIIVILFVCLGCRFLI